MARARPMTIQIPDPITVKDLAQALGQRPYRVVADLIELGQMKFAGNPVEFEAASKVAKKHGSKTKRQD